MYFGLYAGFVTLLIIGIGFPLVVHGERLLGYLWWPYFMAAGLLLAGLSALVRPNWLSVVVGVLGATLAWGSTELKEQAVRAQLGWYPSNPDKPAPPLASCISKWKAPHL